MTGAAWRLMLEHRALWILVVLGAASAALAGALIFYLGWYSGDPGESRVRLAVVGMIAIYPATLISVFFNVALAHAAAAAFEGRNVGLGQALSRSTQRLRQIAGWSLLAAGVGVLLEEIASRLPGGGRLATWIAGGTWSLATIFVVPILALKDTSTMPAVRDSARLFRERWGEGLSGTLAIGAWVFIAVLPLCMTVGAGAGLAETNPTASTVLMFTGVTGIIVVSVLAAGVREVFAVALYRHATGGSVAGFDPADLRNPFFTKQGRGRSGMRWVIYAAMAVAMAVFLLILITGPMRGEPRSWVDGYYRAEFPAMVSGEIRDGMPVRLRGQNVGEVVDHWEEEGEIVVVYQIELRLRAAASGPGGVLLRRGRQEWFLEMRVARASPRE